MLGNNQTERRTKKLKWATVHPISYTEEQEERKQKMWAQTLASLIKQMSAFVNEQNGGESCSSQNDENEEKIRQNVEENEKSLLDEYDDELPELTELSKEICMPVQDKHGYLICRPGYWITDRFKLIKQLGDGVFARVHLVTDANNENSSKKALKIVRNSKAYREAAFHEINVLNSLHSFNSEEKDELMPDHLVIKLLEHFDYYDHICLVFEPYGKSIFDFLKSNGYRPYPLDQIRYIAYQLILAVKFVHDCGIIHTDLKPENILLVNSSSVPINRSTSKRSRKKEFRVLKDASIRLIDFGSAVFDNQHHEDIITTRHYRAPEVLLKNGWSYPCDVWSVGCILFELYSGCFLFPRMVDLEHLAAIERIIGAVPISMKRASSCGFYKNNNQLDINRVQRQSVEKRFRKLFDYMSQQTFEHEQFFDLLDHLLVIDPDLRINLKMAKEHDFFEKLEKPLRLKAENGGNNT